MAIPHTNVVIDDGRIEKIAEFQAPETLYDELINRIRKYHPSDDLSLIKRAYDIAEKSHENQVRKSGEPYIIHPLCVAIILVTIGSLVAVVYPRFKKIQELTDDLNDKARENISGVRVVRAFNAEEYQETKFEKANTAITKNHLFTFRMLGIMMPILTTCMSGLTLAIYWIGAYLINQAEVSERATLIGNMTAFTQDAVPVVMAFIMLVAIFIIFPRTMVSVKRIGEVLDTDTSIKYKDDVVKTDVKGEIEFKNVSFEYPDDHNIVFTNLTTNNVSKFNEHNIKNQSCNYH